MGEVSPVVFDNEGGLWWFKVPQVFNTLASFSVSSEVVCGRGSARSSPHVDKLFLVPGSRFQPAITSASATAEKCDFSAFSSLFTVQEVFVQPLNEFVSLWWTFGGGTKLIIHSGSMVRPTVSLLPPSSQQLSGESATLACMLTDYSPQGAVVTWEVGGTEQKEGVLSSSEVEKSGRYSSSSTLTLSKDRWLNGDQFSCKVLHHDNTQTKTIQMSLCKG
ncbi:immunoglobulin lambda-like polypeptide 5 [Parambassis ranga]|uniref:immunoglobulin lambda-like polypeptide 5 n=1 Tax=Parambassis ranga TaxID=210632 RepID=UPI001042275B|nr:immunoglobulin lambda-like polypeptide 5 [Parambassis ranga]